MTTSSQPLAWVLITALTGAITAWSPSATAAPAPNHGIVAANIEVTINDFLNATNSVVLTAPYKIGDFRLVPEGSNNGDYDTQIGDNPTNNVNDGIMITSVRENGRDDGNFLYPGTNFCSSFIDYHRPGTLGEGAFWIPVAMVWPNANSTAVIEYDINVAAAWFPYNKWIGGFARNSTGANGGANNLLSSSAGLTLGTHFIDQGSGRGLVDLRTLGIDGRTDGVLLVMGAKNEDNYGLSWVNPTNGTWQLYSKDNGTDGTSTEQDPFAFVYVPKTNTTVVSGRFQGDGTILIHSGASPQYTIATLGTGEWELKIPGQLPRFGVLIVSPEGGNPGNQDNCVTYQVNNAGDGWIIQSRDLPAPTVGPFIPALDTPGGGTEPVASFAFIPGPTPGFTVAPTNGAVTTETGDEATFSVVLDTRPTADVTIGVSSTDTTEGTVSVSSLTFTPQNWETPQIVTVSGVNDADVDGPIAYGVTLAVATSSDADYNGLNPADVSLVNADDESGGFTIIPSAGLTTTEAGGFATFTVRLNTQPTADVTFNLSSSDTTEGTVAPSSLTFNNGNWNQDQTITVTGVNDFMADGNIAYTIVTDPASSSDANYNGLNPANVSAVNQDNDSAGLSIVAANGFQVVEGRTNTYTVALQSQPIANVTVTTSSSDTTQGGAVSPSSLNFTVVNWSTPQVVTITGANDLVVDGNTAWRLTNSVTSADAVYAALSPSVLAMTTFDNEAVVSLPSDDLIYGVGQAGVGIDGRATITDPNTPVYTGNTLTVALTANGIADDRLEIRNVGTSAGQIGVSGNAISYGGTAIGTFAGGNGTTPLVTTFNSSASAEAAQALLRNVTFRNVNSDPSRNTRTVLVTLAHADGGSGSASTGIRVSLVRFADFQQDADRGYGVYTNAADIELFQSSADIPLPMGHSADTNNPQMWLDYRDPDNPNQSEALLRFDNIVGNGPGQIPANAIIVSAELLLNVRDAGDGSPLYRMLIPWNEQTETWNSIGNGIQPDNVEATSTFESAFGVPAVSGDTGLGVVSVGVTADVQAWVNGTNNYGWGMTTWNSEINPVWGNGTDGLGFRCCESPSIDDRPRLRVLWVPAGTAATSFRQNVDGYTSAQDTRIRQNSPDLQGGTIASAFVDAIVTGTTNNPDILLFRFDNIFGTGPGQIPAGSTIEAAILELATVIGNGYGDGGLFHAMYAPWQDTDTWNTLGDGIQTDGIEAATTPTVIVGSASLSPNASSGYTPFEVTPDVQAWSSGTKPNNGWAILPWPGGGDGWGISMAESAAEIDRPRLRIYYNPASAPANIVLQPPVILPSSVQVNFTGVANALHYVLRAPSATGPWTTNGTATANSGGNATYTDNAPLSAGAFYRVYKP